MKNNKISLLIIPLSLVFLPALLASALLPRDPESSIVGPSPIRINQLGFYGDAPKIAIVTGLPGGEADLSAASLFYVLSVFTHDTLFTGRLGPVTRSANSSLQTRAADFSAFRTEGVMILSVPGIGSSYPFRIGWHILDTLAAVTLKGYYYQRSAMALDARYAGAWSRPAGHPDTRVLVHPSAASPQRPAGTVISAPGGWYDAGDYNKYIVNSGITMGTLLSAYEDFPAWFDSLHTNIPALEIPVIGPPRGAGSHASSRVSGASSPVSGASSPVSAPPVPDILNEVLYNLRWMLTMQDPGDGGVYNKCTNAAFDGMVMPGVTTAPRYVVQKGTAAALDFAAVMAQAARILRKFQMQLPGLPDSCLRSAVRAWQWAEQHPAEVYDQEAMNKLFQPPVFTGGYGDNRFFDERFWAAVELMVTTGEDGEYQTVVRQRIGDLLSLPSWANVQMLGNYTLLRYRKSLPVSFQPLVQLVQERLLRLADTYVNGISTNAFHTVMGGSKTDFMWGSNSVAANQGVLLINAWLQKNDRKYLDAAMDNMDYLLGRNATGYCFITGMGTFSPIHPHHRPSIADGVIPPVPGLLAGGPNPGRQDHQSYAFTEPETAYTDQAGAYASNEIAINWNAPLVYLAGALAALQGRIGGGR